MDVALLVGFFKLLVALAKVLPVSCEGLAEVIRLFQRFLDPDDPLDEAGAIAALEAGHETSDGIESRVDGETTP